MCGIAGVILKHGQDAALIARYLDHFDASIAHRGPDGTGRHQDESWGFLNRRLAIVGIESGDQPIYSPDRRFGLVYNGETYNDRAIRRSMPAYPFQTHTDSESFLASFLEAPPHGVTRAEGMYAAAIWDDADRTVWLARDPFGMKPLYLFEDAEKFVFCSELRPLATLPGLPVDIDSAAIEDYLTFRYIPGERTVFRQVRRISAGAVIRIRDGRAMAYPVDHQLEPTQAFAGTFDDAKSELRRIVRSSVETHLVAERPLALLLSGGLDSSIIAATLKALDAPMHCFNVGFAEVNEFKYSTDVAQSFALQPHNLVVDEDRLPALFEHLLLTLDEPIADPAQLPLAEIAAAITPTATVVLSGEGADELFGGYPQYAPPSSSFPDYLARSHYFLDDDQLLHQPSAQGFLETAKWFTGRSYLAATAAYDFRTWVPENLMMKADKVLMRHGLEGRFPFLDRTLYRFAASLPDAFKLADDGTTKRLLRAAYADELPRSVVERSKMGFTVPIASILSRSKPMVEALFEDVATLSIGDVIDLDRARLIHDEFQAGQRDLALRCWSLIVLLGWFRGVARPRDQGWNSSR